MNWGAYGGDYIEKVMAVFVAQDEPDTIRRTPASGDGGIDLMIPAGDGVFVDQVKSFSGRLDDSRKAQVKSSWEEFQRDPRLPAGKKKILGYRLVVPIDPTPGEQEWFEKLVAGAIYPVTWRGETHWNSLAAQHPQVVDYFFNGGRDRLLLRQQGLLKALGDPFAPVTPGDIAASLEMTREMLNSADPYYRYEFLTTSEEAPPTHEQLEPLGPYALAHATSIVGGGFLTIRVVPKHRYSLTDEPIGGTLNIKIADPERAREFQKALDGFKRFGRALDIPNGSLFATISAPGGLATTIEGGAARISPALAEQPPTRMRFAIVDANDEVIAQVPLETRSHTIGQAGGAEMILSDPSNTIDVTMQIAPPDEHDSRIAFSITMHNLAGRPARLVGDASLVLGHIRAPNEIRLLAEFGPQKLASHKLDGDVEMLGLGAGLHIADLALLQNFAAFEITVPDELDPSFATELHHYARLLRGEDITGTWDEITVHLKPDADLEKLTPLLAHGGVVAMSETQEVQIPGRDEWIEIGPFTTILAAAELAEGEDVSSGSVRLVPAGGNNQFTQRKGGRAA